MTKNILIPFILIFFVMISSCDSETSDSETSGPETNNPATSHSTDPPMQSTDSAATETHSDIYSSSGTLILPETEVTKLNLDRVRDWESIKRSGKLHVGKLAWNEQLALPRTSASNDIHQQLIEQFAVKHNLELIWKQASSLSELLQLATNNKVDVIPHHLTITKNRRSQFQFSFPVIEDFEYLISKKLLPVELEQLKQRVEKNDPSLEVSVSSSSAYIETLNTHLSDVSISLLEGRADSETMANRLVSNEIQLTLIDGKSKDNLLSYRDDISVVTQLGKKKQYGWIVSNPFESKSNKINQLAEKINESISLHYLDKSLSQIRKIDLDEIKKQNLSLRVITRNSPETYFLWKGELMGFEYELMRKFCELHNIRLEVIVAENYVEMLELLKQGNGDVIAAAVSRTDIRKKDLAFSSRYNRVSEQIVANLTGPKIEKLSDLKERRLHLRKSSSFWEGAKNLATSYGAKLIAVDESLSTEMLIAQVADGNIDLTIADDNLTAIEKTYRDNISTPLTVKESVPYAYGVRPQNTKILTALNRFIKKYYRGVFYNVVKNKYFASKKQKLKHQKQRLAQGSSLSAYDDMVKQKSREFGFDWRLIISQMYQESRFDPLAKSSAGAQGLMQVLPRTAKELGYDDLFEPENGINAGITYLDWTRQRFNKSLALEQQTLFALAAYNAGFGHVKDAQRLATKLGLDPNKWFNHVEKAMLLLQQPKYYKQARFGYCRGSEPVNYVRQINQRYLGYTHYQ